MDKISSGLFRFDKYLLIACLLIAGFILFKIPVLFIPYFWDEAWSYMPAICQLYRRGLSLMPGALPADVYRGHPLLFYFLAAGWMKLFGGSFFAMHSFALLITCLTLFTVFIITRSLFSSKTGVLSLLIFAVQPLVLGQATFLLPEMLMSLWSICCLYSYIKNHFTWYVLFGTCLLYTKETGIVLIFSIFIFQLFLTLKKPGSIFTIGEIKKFMVICLPILFAFFYFILQKNKMGWFFFPEHMGMINHDLQQIQQKFILCFHLLFTEDKRVFLTITGAIILVYFSVKKSSPGHIRMVKEGRYFFLTGILFIFTYMVFCAANFFTNRYLLSIFPIWSIMVAVPLVWATGKNSAMFLIVACMIGVIFYFANTGLWVKPENRISAEFNLGFSDEVLVQRDLCDYLQNGNYFDKKIFVPFLYQVFLTNPDAGYLHKGNNFPNLMGGAPCQAEFIIYSWIEKKFEPDNASTLCRKTLVKRFERGYSWVELYKNTTTDNEKR